MRPREGAKRFLSAAAPRRLIINADGYGFTGGVTRAIEECVRFGTVRSISVNVNFSHAERLPGLVEKYPFLSVGCHVNPVVGRPVLPESMVPSLLDENGEFLYRGFVRKMLAGKIDMNEIRAEMDAQIKKTRDLAGSAFSHVDFHMGLHRLPFLYGAFLDIVEKNGLGRIRTHRYRVGMESRFPLLRHLLHMFSSPMRIPRYAWNVALRAMALGRGLSMPDRRVEITRMSLSNITTENYKSLLKNLPAGFNEFVAHPGHVDGELKRWSTYIEQREMELSVLTSRKFRTAINESDVRLAGYRDIPLK